MPISDKQIRQLREHTERVKVFDKGCLRCGGVLQHGELAALVVEGGDVMPMATFVCQTCAHVELVSAVKAGVDV